MDIPEDLIDPPFVPYAVALGELCNSWAKLETGVRMLLMSAAGWVPDRRAFGIVHCFGMRESMNAIRLCILDHPDEPVKRAALDHMNYIDNELRPRRNRHVHDPWHYSDQTEQMNRVDYTPRTRKQPLEWIAADWSSLEGPEDVWILVGEIKRCDALLYDIQGALNGTRPSVEALLQARLQQRYRGP